MSNVEPIKISYEEFLEQQHEGGIGYCTSCSQQHDGYVDPDGREQLCEHCGTHTVFGLEELLVIGSIEFTGDDE